MDQTHPKSTDSAAPRDRTIPLKKKKKNVVTRLETDFQADQGQFDCGLCRGMPSMPQTVPESLKYVFLDSNVWKTVLKCFELFGLIVFEYQNL